MGDGMEPLPENIDGAKTVEYSHEIHHRVNWGYLAIGAAVIVVAYLYQQRQRDD